MFLIFYLFIWLKSSNPSVPVDRPEQSPQVNKEFGVYLEQQRGKKTFDESQNLFFNKLLNECKKLDECYKNIVSQMFDFNND